nr:F-box domain, cyclin-like protein [Tanacetum cinerariifolium]
KTITALSLILKTLGTLADPPEGVEIIWCKQKDDMNCGYYEIDGDSIKCGSAIASKKIVSRTSRRCPSSLEGSKTKSFEKTKTSFCIKSTESTVQCTRSWTMTRQNLLDEYEGDEETIEKIKLSEVDDIDDLPYVPSRNMKKKPKKAIGYSSKINETWVQYDSC